jgi:septal ring factor EnvC (AmiA/AmiB activator)
LPARRERPAHDAEHLQEHVTTVTRIRHGRTPLRLLVVVGVAVALVLPEATEAQEPNPAETERRLNEVRAQSGQVALEVDALEAQDDRVQAAIATLETNVATQAAELDEAERALAAAEAEVATAEANVVTAQGRIDTLNQQTDDLVVEAFVNPASESALDGFKADTLSDMMVKQALVDISADSDADMLDQLEQAHEDLAVEQANKEAAAEAAEEMRVEAESALEEVENALAQQQAFATDVEERLNAKLAEAESLRTFDAQLADQLVREQAEVAARLRAAQEAAARQAAAEAAAAAAAAAQSSSGGGGGGSSGGGGGRGGGDPAPSVIAPAPGGLATVTCPYGGSIKVAGSIASNVQALLDAAAAQGVSLCASSGWRSPESQIELRRLHCGTSNYAIYYMPSSQCNPPTARPGSSMHERGLAIDFSCNGGGAIRRGNSCWNFLAAHANDYGLYNLPSEPWHWSTNGN